MTGKQLKLLLINKGIKQKEFADSLGYSQTWVSLQIKSKRITDKFAKKIKQHFNK